MTAQDVQPFIEKLTVVGELFDAKLSEAKLTLYFDALQDLPLWVVLDGLDAAVRQCRFMPKPVEIRQLAVGTPEDEAEAAWVNFKDMMRTVGAYRTPRFDAVVALAIADTFGTWPAACAADLSPEMWASKRKEFLRAFVRHQCGWLYVRTGVASAPAVDFVRGIECGGNSVMAVDQEGSFVRVTVAA